MTTSKLEFNHSFSKRFPGISVPTKVTPVKAPELLCWSESVASLLEVSRLHDQAADLFSGNHLLPEMSSTSSRYGGHQFGQWAGQLGDGRATSLGELITSRHKHFEIQLKGAGMTPFSRRGDGRAVLRSSLREYLCSEAMFYLGVPTTRALCLVTTGEPVMRDMFYDGNPAPEPGAIVTRVSPTFLRFGHFQILAADRDHATLKDLIDHTRQEFFPEAKDTVELFHIVCRKTAELIAQWMGIGFVHGVMNTDNMSILGLTIDYGPYGFLDIYNPEWTPNTTDFREGRYRYENQPGVARWNLERFAEALSLIETDIEGLRAGITLFETAFRTSYFALFAKKLGLSVISDDLMVKLDTALQSTEIDMTIFFRKLARVRAGESLLSAVQESFYENRLSAEASESLQAFESLYRTHIAADSLSIENAVNVMNGVNPVFVLRNYLAVEALDELALGKRTQLDQLLKAIETPLIENEITLSFFKRMPDWARTRPGSATLSCSS